MKKHSPDCRLSIAAGLLLLTVVVGPAAGNDAATSVRQEPGPVAGFDPFPNACVDCHLSFPERGLDVRIRLSRCEPERGVVPVEGFGSRSLRTLLPTTRVS